jgi:hypothetical protein
MLTILFLCATASADSAAQAGTVGVGMQLGLPPALSVQVQLPDEHAIELAVRPPITGRLALFEPAYSASEGYDELLWLRARWLTSPGALVSVEGDRGAELRWYTGVGGIAWFETASPNLWGGPSAPLGLSFEPTATPLQLWADVDLRLETDLDAWQEASLQLGCSAGARWFF